MRADARTLALHLTASFALETVAQAQVQRILRVTYRKAAFAFSTGGLGAMRESLTLMLPVMEAAIQDIQARAIRRFGAITLSRMEAIRQGKAAGDDPTSWDALIKRWHSNYGAAAVTNVDDTTRSSIADIITAGQSEGLSIPKISKAIRGLGEDFTRNRAQAIAITETHNAGMFALHETALASGLPLKKKWLAVEDGRTRPAHHAADNQVQDIDDPFMVGGEAMQRPGDPRASPRNTVRCRCTMQFISAREGQISDE